MMNLGERVQKLINYKNLNYRSLSKELPYSDVQIRRICLNESIPKMDFVDHLIAFFSDINPVWIVTGKGEFLKEATFQGLETYPKKELLDFILENRNEFLEEVPAKIDLLIDVFSTIKQKEALENLNNKIEELNKLIKNK